MIGPLFWGVTLCSLSARTSPRVNLGAPPGACLAPYGDEPNRSKLSINMGTHYEEILRFLKSSQK